MALGGNGNIALVGAGMSGYYGHFHAPGGNGPPTFFSRSNTTWTQDAELSASDASSPFDNFGYAVALSADGNTALIGDPAENEEAGSAYVFTSSDSSWTQQTKLTGNDVTTGWQFGASVTLSADGHTALVGAPAPDAGSAYVFNDSGSSWTQQAELTPEDAEVTSFDGLFGAAVALDGEGSVALIGAPRAEEDLGAAYAFAGEGPNWAQQTEFLVDSATPYDYFGGAVALNGSGTAALIGRYDPGAYFFGMPPVHFTESPAGAKQPEVGTPAAPTSTTVATQTSPTPAPDGVATALGGGSAAVQPNAVQATVGSEVLSPPAFPAAPRGTSTLAAKSRYGARVTYTLNASSDVRFTIAEVQRARCVKPTKANRRRARRCTRLVTLPGSFTRAGTAGANRFRFTGRLEEHKLAVGSYQLIANPIAGDNSGHAATASFRIIR